MARITAPTGGDFPQVQVRDYDPVPVVLNSLEVDPNSAYPQSGPRLKLVWALESNPEEWLWDWASIKLGEQRSGQVAKLRTILNAIHGRATNAPVAWFDDETFEYALDGDAGAPATGRLAAGVRVVIRGVNEAKPTPENPAATRFKITAYQPAAGAAAAPASAAAPAPAAPAPAPQPAAAAAAAPAAATGIVDF
jgi:hypothetical protein